VNKLGNFTPWFFVIATIIATFGISLIVNHAIDKIKEGYEKYKDEKEAENIRGREQTLLFMKVAIIEIIPIVLIVCGFLGIEISRIKHIEHQMLIPLVINIGFWVLAICTILLNLNTKIKKNSFGKQEIKITAMIGIALASAFPIISVVASMILLNQ
jgi:F0F1-type ATP synthase membrane subunit c/vacuolar-type H+-ATPase subunit K